jgi:hypothetical protein
MATARREKDLCCPLWSPRRCPHRIWTLGRRFQTRAQADSTCADGRWDSERAEQAVVEARRLAKTDTACCLDLAAPGAFSLIGEELMETGPPRRVISIGFHSMFSLFPTKFPKHTSGSHSQWLWENQGPAPKDEELRRGRSGRWGSGGRMQTRFATSESKGIPLAPCVRKEDYLFAQEINQEKSRVPE